ncbi:hypothetical protein M885DRAFT_227194 [Pelagophyceae sp. CCMP2097]|nr:hypothetical protein M885DRAFT_227194 [Pelagophyceae sp. CCMP2097]
MPRPRNAAGSSRAWWQRVTFDGSSLPPYLYDVNRTVGGWKDFHFGGDLSRATKANIHGYGYMLMCRFYAGLIHHAPLARRFDYYLRIDGDSRLSATTVDPFQFMQTRGAKYGSLGGNYAETAGAATALPHIFAKMRPELDLALAKWGARPDCPADAYTCPFTHPKAKQHKQCNLRCRLALPEKVGQVPLPVPICSDAVISKVPSCPSFYNNFEVVDMRAFRTPEQWDFFLLAERSHAFLCEQSAGRSHAGKCGGGGMGDVSIPGIQDPRSKPLC